MLKMPKEKEQVYLFIRKNDGTIKDEKIKKMILEQYCKERGFEIIGISYCDISEYAVDGCLSIFEQLTTIINEIDIENTIMMFDLMEIANTYSSFKLIHEVLRDMMIDIITVCDGSEGIDFIVNDNEIAYLKSYFWRKFTYER